MFVSGVTLESGKDALETDLRRGTCWAVLSLTEKRIRFTSTLAGSSGHELYT